MSEFAGIYFKLNGHVQPISSIAESSRTLKMPVHCKFIALPNMRHDFVAHVKSMHGTLSIMDYGDSFYVQTKHCVVRTVPNLRI